MSHDAHNWYELALKHIRYWRAQYRIRDSLRFPGVDQQAHDAVVQFFERSVKGSEITDSSAYIHRVARSTVVNALRELNASRNVPFVEQSHSQHSSRENDFDCLTIKEDRLAIFATMLNVRELSVFSMFHINRLDIEDRSDRRLIEARLRLTSSHLRKLIERIKSLAAASDAYTLPKPQKPFLFDPNTAAYFYESNEEMKEILRDLLNNRSSNWKNDACYSFLEPTDSSDSPLKGDPVSICRSFEIIRKSLKTVIPNASDDTDEERWHEDMSILFGLREFAHFLLVLAWIVGDFDCLRLGFRTIQECHEHEGVTPTMDSETLSEIWQETGQLH